jgi:nucleoside-diphosphate-sugar epimerase
MMHKVLLTGATGFIGQHCILPLLAQGFAVHAIGSRSASGRSDGDAAVVYHQVDLFDFAQIAAVMRVVRPTHLIHLAWCVKPGEWANSLDNFRWVQASLELVRQFREAGGQRAVLMGSDAEYDQNYGFCSEPVTPRHPDTLYGVCKVSLSALVAAYAQQTGLSLAWARCFAVYGPHEHPRRLVASVIRALLRHESARCSHGQQMRDFLYVQDVAEALTALLVSPVTGAINIASGQPTPLKRVILTIAQQLAQEDLVQLGALPPPAHEVPLIVADIRRLTDELGWQPQFTLEGGIDRTIEWWKTHLDKP